MTGYKLHLIRHGLTRGNIDGIYMGSGTDLPLCQQGIEELERLDKTYSYPWIEKLYVSPLKRATQTAEILYPDLDYKIVSDMRECAFGEFEGKTLAELRNDENFAKWLDPKQQYQPQGAESNEDFAARCLSGLNDIFVDMMMNGIHEAGVITHGGVIAMLMTLIAFPQKPTHEWNTDSGCGFTVQTTTEMWMRDGIVEAVQIIPRGYGED